MDQEMKYRKSLPPLVDGKIHGYLKLAIDEVIWSKRSPGEVSVLASWWGEADSAEFRPPDITKSAARLEQETTVTYAIRTNLALFEEYIKNCETVELIVISEKTNTILGTSQITDLSEILTFKPCFRYYSVISNNGTKIGEIHVVMKLIHGTKSSNMQLKIQKQEEKLLNENTMFSCINPLIYNQERSVKNQKDIMNEKNDFIAKPKSEETDLYKSILKCKRTEFQEPVKKFNEEVTDKLVAQVVARAQRLRGAILKETYNEDPLALSDTSINNDVHSFTLPQDEANLYEYFLGREMTSFHERKALNTLRSASPTPSLIDFASKSIATPRNFSTELITNKSSYTKNDPAVEESQLREHICNKSKEALLVNHVDCIRIFVESFTLSPAGYRRVKSSSVSRNDSALLGHVSYFVQYETVFRYPKQAGEKSSRENKPVRICSKKQVDQVIYFNHDGTYSISKMNIHMDYPLNFKMFVRHLNQKSPTELGVGSMCISDITKTESWSSTQRLAIINKGIKMGELSVTVELGSDFVHFGKQYVDGIMASKENIPVSDIRSTLSTESWKSKSATGTQSKSSSRVSSVPTKGVECLTTDNDTNLFATKDVTGRKKDSMDDKRIDIMNRENANKGKILLHGLIYVAEGRELPDLNTYLVCRAFWREDKATSQTCYNTRNPFYRFCQLVPLIHGTDLLDRIRDNYIIIEVYSKSNVVDNLLGLAKLPVHQLYIAYKDPLVLPHLLLSKYPVISVDGWVPIINPVTGQSCGELLALVALGTAEQIALLEMSRGLTIINAIPQTIYNYPQNLSTCTQYIQNGPESSAYNTAELQQNVQDFPRDNNYTFRSINTAGRESQLSNYKTQESQTDITTLKETKFGRTLEEEGMSSDHLVLHRLVDRLAQVLTTNKANTDQAAQTDVYVEEKKQPDEEQTCLNELNLNNTSDESDSSSLRNNFQLPTEMYRSVGVGAEYDEELDQQANGGYSNAAFALPNAMPNDEKEEGEDSTFRAVVEIECALHLPKVEQTNCSIEPSTYVTFQANKPDTVNQLNSYITTNVYPNSCNPKWNWKCDTRLPTELLLNDGKRLILKVWRLLDSDANVQINLERDVVIGFSAIDLSVLVSGFPTVSGWFHIMDFTGKCNGQIKVSVTPLDNLSSFGKSISTLSTTRMPVCDMSQTSWSPPYSYEIQPNDIEQNNVHSTLSMSTHNEDKSVHSDHQLTDHSPHVGHVLEDVSMSFLSLSLKQKLTELDAITKRLDSRLRDVTSTAFEDDFENEFDLNEPNSDTENNDNRNIDGTTSATTSHSNSKFWQMPETDRRLPRGRGVTEDRAQPLQIRNESRGDIPESHIDQTRIMNYETVNVAPPQTVKTYMQSTIANDNYPMPRQSEYPVETNRTLDNDTDYPVRGTKTHINHLLDKLSLQLPVRSLPAGTMPMRKNIIDLLTNLHQNNNNNVQENRKCNHEAQVCTIPTQTDHMEEPDIPNAQTQTTSRTIAETDNAHDDKTLSDASAKSHSSNRMSTVIREELIAEENSDSSKCDELTTYLITSNVRHMDLDSIFNPLLYQHLVPDLRASNAGSPEGESIEQLDNHYARTFSTSIDNRLSKMQSATEAGTSLSNENNVQDRTALELPESSDLFRMTPSGVSENIDGNIDLTVVRKSSYNDLMASNSTESTTTISLEKPSMQHAETGLHESSYSTSSEASVPALSRQAPDGGNPIEDISKPSTILQQDDSHDLSSSS